MSTVLTILAAALLTLALAGAARAEPPNARATPIYVLSVLTDEADDQADALTQALRARVKQAPGLSLLETQQSLETLTIALRCPPKPDAPCLQRIGDQLHSDHFVWATLGKKRGELLVEAHYWSRGKPQVDASATFSENVKDASDPALRAVVTKLLAELTGGGGTEPAASSEAATGTLVVHAGGGEGSVLIDGVEKAKLEDGVARVEVGEGTHTVTVRVPGFQAPSLKTSVKPGAEKDVSFALAPGEPPPSEEHVAEPEGAESKPFPVHKVVGYSAIGAGAILLVVAAVEMVGWFSDKSDSNNERANIPASVPDACQVASTAPYFTAASTACSDSNDAKTKSMIAWVTGIAGLAAGGAGAWLLVTDHDGEASSPAGGSASGARLRLGPVVGPREGGLRLRLEF